MNPQRQQVAFQALCGLLDFADFENGQVPNEFLDTMEALAAVLDNPTVFLFHDENGRFLTRPEQSDFQKRLKALQTRAKQGIPSMPATHVPKICGHCERFIWSTEATICLWCGELVSEDKS